MVEGSELLFSESAGIADPAAAAGDLAGQLCADPERARRGEGIALPVRAGHREDAARKAEPGCSGVAAGGLAGSAERAAVIAPVAARRARARAESLARNGGVAAEHTLRTGPVRPATTPDLQGGRARDARPRAGAFRGGEPRTGRARAPRRAAERDVKAGERAPLPALGASLDAPIGDAPRNPPRRVRIRNVAACHQRGERGPEQDFFHGKNDLLQDLIARREVFARWTCD